MPYETPELRRAYLNKHRAVKRALGICRDCTNKAKPGSTRCQKCLDYHAQNRRDLLARKDKDYSTEAIESMLLLNKNAFLRDRRGPR